MTVSLVTTILLMLSGILAGTLGALIGIGGGLILVPALVLGFGYDMRIAVAASLVSVVASSTAAGSVYVGKGLANMKLGMVLEVATTIGGLCGGFAATLISGNILTGLFSCLMAVMAILILRTSEEVPTSAPSGSLEKLEPAPVTQINRTGLSGSYYDPYLKKTVDYHAQRLPFGMIVSGFAGIISGMLGVGGGFIKVPAMTLGMKVPIKMAAATSNFMIGVTAVSSLFIYFAKGLVYPVIAGPIALGVVVGAFSGAKLSQVLSPKMIRNVFAIILIFVSCQMFLNAIGVKFARS
jgi:uncharacterized membrane protein YfcA